jgi:hypothetical protein
MINSRLRKAVAGADSAIEKLPGGEPEKGSAKPVLATKNKLFEKPRTCPGSITPKALIPLIVLFAAATLLLLMMAVTARGQATSAPMPYVTMEGHPGASLTPQSVTQSFTAWNAVALLIGATLWHVILKITPFGKAHGGVLRGVRDWFFDVGWKPAVTLPSIPAIPAPTAASAALEAPRRTNTSGDAPNA